MLKGWLMLWPRGFRQCWAPTWFGCQVNNTCLKTNGLLRSWKLPKTLDYFSCCQVHFTIGSNGLKFIMNISTYRKVASSKLSWLAAHLRIFRLSLKGKFNTYALWPLTKSVQNSIIDQSTARNFTVHVFTCIFITFLGQVSY